MRLIVLAMMLFAACSACAEGETAAPEARWDVARLMQRLAQVQHAQGQFVEKKYLRILNKPLESSGTLIYQAPGHLEKHTRAPKIESLVLDKSTLLIDSKASGKRRLTLQDYPLLWALIEGIRSTLAGDVATLNRFYQIKLDGDISRWRLILIPTDAKALELVREIRISGREDRVSEIETLETTGDRSVMSVTEDRVETP
ncbi:MAG: LolA-related protein [Pseudomonadota bacterium]